MMKKSRIVINAILGAAAIIITYLTIIKGHTLPIFSEDSEEI